MTMVLELDEASEAVIASRADERGLKPEELVMEMIRQELSGDQLTQHRLKVAQAMITSSKGRYADLDGMSMREFAHADHKY